MAYQSKTYSLSDEVVAAIEAARAKGETPNQLLRRVLLPHQDLDATGKRRYCPNCGVEITSADYEGGKCTNCGVGL